MGFFSFKKTKKRVLQLLPMGHDAVGFFRSPEWAFSWPAGQLRWRFAVIRVSSRAAFIQSTLFYFFSLVSIRRGGGEAFNVSDVLRFQHRLLSSSWFCSLIVLFVIYSRLVRGSPSIRSAVREVLIALSRSWGNLQIVLNASSKSLHWSKRYLSQSLFVFNALRLYKHFVEIM